MEGSATVKSLFNVPQFMIFPRLTINLNDLKSLISLVNYLYLKIFLSLVFIFMAPQINFKWGFHYIYINARHFAAFSSIRVHMNHKLPL
jgi:hypothetical protein